MAAADLVVTPWLDPATDVIFSRVGAVYHDSVKIVARYPEANANGTKTLRLLYRESADINSTVWKDGPLLTFEEDRDWVDTVKLTGLWPNTSYEWFDLLSDYLYPKAIGTSGDSEEISLPLDNYPVPPRVEFLLFLGDFIYADVPVYIGDDKEAYRRLYRRNYNSDSFRKIYERLPIFHAYDDHEFINNFGASGNDSTSPYLNASAAFKLYNANGNFDPVTPDEHYYEFIYGDTAFFVLDTRRYRAELGIPNRTMLGEVQLAALHEWLSRANTTSTFKFIVSSVPFTSLWGHDAQVDSWAGFLEEKQLLLALFHSVPNVIILSGDRHEFAAVEFTGPKPEDYPVWEFSTSPLSMFYIPFIRTLRMQSETYTQRSRTKVVSTETGPETVTYTENIPLERVVKYIATGNSKWCGSALEIDTRNPELPTLRLETMIDGKRSFK
ncbi:hypothetical protein H0H81_011315 [Sphagnurus paluster]|uniref:PhoD-like phosphatase metallophosphatase domain-containing protein n=1 Tax=Sphagnurus paluster TaxID=117069 RepID=A0A9P7FU88_9AGAR|nr:hypothetical protein H0H81_011315 [Sphagnurus paluster]